MGRSVLLCLPGTKSDVLARLGFSSLCRGTVADIWLVLESTLAVNVDASRHELQ